MDAHGDGADHSGVTAAAAVVCRGLTKDYGRGRGVFDLDLTVLRGEILGFVGPNGAGKTTTIRLLMDLIRPDRGSATVLGLDARRDSLVIKGRVGYLPGELAQFPGVSAGYVIGLLAGLRGGVDPGRIEELAERLELDLDPRYEKLSHGNKQKVHLVQAFMHRPELLVLDEPPWVSTHSSSGSSGRSSRSPLPTAARSCSPRTSSPRWSSSVTGSP